MYIIDLLIIACVMVFILDLSGVVDELERILQKKWKRKVIIRKPWSCSLCMTWWLGLIYLFINKYLSIINIGLVAAFAFLTPLIKDILLSIRELLNRLVWLWDNRGE